MQTLRINSLIKNGSVLDINIIVRNFRSMSVRSPWHQVASQRKHVMDAILDIEGQLRGVPVQVEEFIVDTADLETIDQLDSWLTGENGCKATFNNDQIMVELKGTECIHIPEDIEKRVMNTGTSESWFYRGFEYMAHKSHSHNGDGQIRVDFECKNPPANNVKHQMYDFTKTGYGENLIEAIRNALQAPAVET